TSLRLAGRPVVGSSRRTTRDCRHALRNAVDVYCTALARTLFPPLLGIACGLRSIGWVGNAAGSALCADPAARGRTARSPRQNSCILAFGLCSPPPLCRRRAPKADIVTRVQ